MADIGSALRRMRTDPARWAGDSKTLADVARELGVSVGAVSRWETGDTSPSIERLTQLLDVLRATPGERAALLSSEEGA